MSKKVDKILNRGRIRTLNKKTLGILGKIVPSARADEEERGEDGKWTSGGGASGSEGTAKGGKTAARPKSEMEPDKEKAFAKAFSKLNLKGKPGVSQHEGEHGAFGTDPDSLVDSADKKDDGGWDESKHPRDKGKFSAGEGAPSGQGEGAKELHGMAAEAKARIAARAAAGKQARGKLVGQFNKAAAGAHEASTKAQAALAEMRGRAGIHPALAGKSAKAAAEHAEVLKAAAAQSKDPEHAKVAAKAEMHAKAAKESAEKAKTSATPIAAAHHAAAAKESAGKAEGLREHVTREVGKKAEKAEREPHGKEGEEEGVEGTGHHLLPIRELWNMLVGK